MHHDTNIDLKKKETNKEKTNKKKQLEKHHPPTYKGHLSEQMDLINDDQTDFAHVPLALRLGLKVVFLGMIAAAKTQGIP